MSEHKHHIFDLAAKNMGGDDKPKPKKKVKEVRTRKAKSGGYIHEHHHEHPDAHPMEEHTSPNAEAMVGHMMEHMGGQEPEDGQAAEAPMPGASAAAAPAAPAAAAGVGA